MRLLTVFLFFLFFFFKIYPSEFGLERMKKEEISGPTELTQKPYNDMMGNDSQDLEGT